MEQQVNTDYRRLPMPSKIQMQTVVKGDDRYRPRYRPNPLVVLLLIGIPVIVFLIWIVK